MAKINEQITDPLLGCLKIVCHLNHRGFSKQAAIVSFS